MGATAYEISGFREDRDHPAHRTIPPPGASGAGADRNPPRHVLPLVRSVSGRWAGGTGGSFSPAQPSVEPYPRRDPRPHRRIGARRARAVTARTGRAVYRHAKLLRVGILGLPTAESA